MSRSGMTKFQRAKVHLGLKMMMPAIHALIKSSPALQPNEKSALQAQFSDAFTKLDRATQAEG